ncbi:MAG: glycosyl hydrolase family 18 protein [Tissierellia bacterium]|nr:glycosyl hydrolase family 18 protein [Tissierellia bacterium]
MKKFFIGILIILLLAIGVFFFVENRDSNTISKKYDGFSFISEGEDIDPTDFDRIDGQFYLSLEYIKDHIDKDVVYDENEKVVILTNQAGTKYLPFEEKTATFNGGKVDLRSPVIEKNGKIMLPIEAFIYDYDVNLRYDQDRQLLLLDRTDREYAEGIGKTNVILREEHQKSSPIVKKLEKGEKLYVYGEEGKYYRVRQIEGLAGYVKKDDIKVDFPQNKFERTIIEEKQKEALEPLNLTWDYTYGNQSDESVTKIKKIPGLNVICPTWFSIRNNQGDLIDRGNLNYVEKYQDMNVDVWGYLDNSFDKDITHEALKSPTTRKKIIAKTLELCKKYKMTGINIDFEDTYIDDRDLITQFVRELASEFKKENLIVSVDVTPQISPDVTKEPYDRKALANICDYVIVMTYDQHWGSSDTAGSVAQYKWVEGSINVLFRNIPNDKMVLGIPLYSRLWVEDNDKVSSSTISMSEVNRLIEEKKLEPEWDEESSQYYIEYRENGKIYKVWIEDYKSIEHKSSLVNKYNLAGVGTWRKGFETQDIWKAIDKQLSYRKNR